MVLKLFTLFKNNLAISIVILVYAFIALAQLSWGLPNNNHPFSYHMDEWAQARSLKSVFTQGTPHIDGGGNGTFFFYIIGGLLFAPFIILGLVNPFAIQSSLQMLDAQRRFFEVLRLQSVFYIILGVILVVYISKKYFKSNPFISECFLIITPLIFILSVFYRYDPPVVFWILLSLLFSFRYMKKPSPKNFFLSGIISSLAVTIKISCAPLLFTYIASFFIFTPKWKKKLSLLFIGISIFTLVFFIFGIPDAFFKFKQFSHWFYYSALSVPAHNSGNFDLGIPYPIDYVLFEYPSLFGHAFYYIFIFSTFYFSVKVFKSIFKDKLRATEKLELFLLTSFLAFVLSIISLRIGGTGNRMFVILPFFALISNITIQDYLKKLTHKKKTIFIIFLGFVIFYQTIESLSWFSTKMFKDPRETSSEWVIQNIPKKSMIGLEEDVIFQDVPNVILKDYYSKKYFKDYNTLYSYKHITSKSDAFPPLVIITRDDIAQKYIKESDKKTIINSLRKKGYKKLISFTPDYTYFRYFNNEKNYFFSGITASPTTITIYKKTHDD